MIKNKFCECGCGIAITGKTSKGAIKRFVQGHNKSMLGQKHTKSAKNKIGRGNKGKVRPEELREKISKSLKGNPSPMKGKCHSKKSRKEMSEAHKLMTGNKNSFYGKHHTEETKKEIGIALKDYFKKNGVREGYRLTDEHKNNLQKSARIRTIRCIQENGRCLPNYNKEACEFFKSFDKQNNTKGKYALYGGGEHHIKELGYFVDYFNLDLKLIMEFDEPKHYEINGNLKKRDKIRQQEIQKYYPDYEFRRIKQ
jgi:hypothetical protein